MIHSLGQGTDGINSLGQGMAFPSVPYPFPAKFPSVPSTIPSMTIRSHLPGALKGPSRERVKGAHLAGLPDWSRSPPLPSTSLPGCRKRCPEALNDAVHR